MSKTSLGIWILLWNVKPVSLLAGEPDANSIIQRSVAALEADWKAAPQYNYSERDVEDRGTRTYQVTMVLGSPYRRLVEINGVPLSSEEQKREQHKMRQAIARRRSESQQAREHRIVDYNLERHRDHQLITELTKAMTFALSGMATVDSHRAYVLVAKPRPGYRPPSEEAKVLTGMQGMLWIDTVTFQWVKVEAEVIRPVSIASFLAKVEPGTRFELTKTAVPGGPWLPAHFSVQSKAKILSFIGRNHHADETYFDYQEIDNPGPKTGVPRS